MRTFGRYSLSSFLSAVVTAASVLVTIALVLAVAVTVASPWMRFGDGNGQLGIPVAMVIDEQALGVQAPSLGTDSARLTDVTGTLQFPVPSNRALIAPMLALIAMLVAAIWVLDQLRALFRALREGRVFASSNVRRVQRVGWAVILVEPVRATIIYFATAYAESHFVAEGLRFTSDFDLKFGMIFSGLVILVIAEVFRAGAKLDEDQSLTI